MSILSKLVTARINANVKSFSHPCNPCNPRLKSPSPFPLLPPVKNPLLLLVLFALSASAQQPGSLDPSFDPGTGVDQSVFGLAVQPDGKILIGGDFTTFRGVGRK